MTEINPGRILRASATIETQFCSCSSLSVGNDTVFIGIANFKTMREEILVLYFNKDVVGVLCLYSHQAKSGNCCG